MIDLSSEVQNQYLLYTSYTYSTVRQNSYQTHSGLKNVFRCLAASGERERDKSTYFITMLFFSHIITVR